MLLLVSCKKQEQSECFVKNACNVTLISITSIMTYVVDVI